MAAQRDYPLNRREVVKALLADRGELLVVAGLGGTVWDCTAAGDTPLNFYLWGAMGSAAMIGLGLANAQPDRRVLVISGDGEQLMGLGGLATIGVEQPRNLAIAVIDNEHFGETGMQPTHTAGTVDLAAVASAAGFAQTGVAKDEASLNAMIPMVREAAGPVLLVVKVNTDSLPLVMPSRDGAYLKDRFRAALLGPDAVS